MGLVVYGLSYLPNNILKPFYFKLVRLWCKLYILALNTNLYIHQKYTGTLPKQFIVIANHPSLFEDAGIVVTFDAYPVAKSSIANWFIVGKINKSCGTIFVQRKSAEGRQAAYNEIVKRLKQGNSIAIFPEGQCGGRRVNEFMLGAFRASIETGVPIIPVFIHYEAQESFEWMKQSMIRKMWEIIIAPNHNANYYIHQPIYPKKVMNYIQPKDSAKTLKAAIKLKQHIHLKYMKWQEKHLD